MTDTTALSLQASGAGLENRNAAGEPSLDFDVPPAVQMHIDRLLDHYAKQAMKPKIKLIGDPLQVVSNLVVELQKTIPAHLAISGKIVLDFMIEAICAFCRAHNINAIAFTFEFKR